MSVTIGRGDYQALVRLLAAHPDFQTEDRRRGLVDESFRGVPRGEVAKGLLDLRDPPHQAAVSLVGRLLEFGRLGEHQSLSRVLLTLRERAGDDGRAELDRLIALLIDERALFEATRTLLEQVASGSSHRNEELLRAAFANLENDPRNRLRVDGNAAELATHWWGVLENARCIEGHSPLVWLISQWLQGNRRPEIDYPGGLDGLLRDLDRPCGGDGVVPRRAGAAAPAQPPSGGASANRQQVLRDFLLALPIWLPLSDAVSFFTLALERTHPALEHTKFDGDRYAISGSLAANLIRFDLARLADGSHGVCGLLREATRRGYQHDSDVARLLPVVAQAFGCPPGEEGDRERRSPEVQGSGDFAAQPDVMDRPPAAEAQVTTTVDPGADPTGAPDESPVAEAQVTTWVPRPRSVILAALAVVVVSVPLVLWIASGPNEPVAVASPGAPGAATTGTARPGSSAGQVVAGDGPDAGESADGAEQGGASQPPGSRTSDPGAGGRQAMDRRALRIEVERLLAARLTGDPASDRMLLIGAFRDLPNDPSGALRLAGTPIQLARAWTAELIDAECMAGHSPLFRLLEEAYRGRRAPEVSGFGGYQGLLRALDDPCATEAGVSTASPEYVLSVNELASAGSDLRVLFSLRYPRGQYFPMTAVPGEITDLHTGAEYRIKVEASRQLYFYILHFDSNGMARELMQADRDGSFEAPEERNRLAPGDVVRLPGRRKYKPDVRYRLEGKSGQEHFHFILSTVPLPEIVDVHVANAGTGIDADRARAALAQVPSSERGSLTNGGFRGAGPYSDLFEPIKPGRDAPAAFRCRRANHCQTELVFNHLVGPGS